jgi:hypothetical protein
MLGSQRGTVRGLNLPRCQEAGLNPRARALANAKGGRFLYTVVPSRRQSLHLRRKTSHWWGWVKLIRAGMVRQFFPSTTTAVGNTSEQG